MVATLAAHLGVRTQLGVVVGRDLVACGGLLPAGPCRAEAAVLVADPWQGRGLGRLLLRRALADPRWRGQDVVVHVAVDNPRALRLARTVLAEATDAPVIRRLERGTVEYEAVLVDPGGRPPAVPRRQRRGSAP